MLLINKWLWFCVFFVWCRVFLMVCVCVCVPLVLCVCVCVFYSRFNRSLADNDILLLFRNFSHFHKWRFVWVAFSFTNLNTLLWIIQNFRFCFSFVSTSIRIFKYHNFFCVTLPSNFWQIKNGILKYRVYFFIFCFIYIFRWVLCERFICCYYFGCF